MKNKLIQRVFLLFLCAVVAAGAMIPATSFAAPKKREAAITLATPKLSVVKTSLKASEIKLSWSKVASATGYELQRKAASDKDYKTILTTAKRSYTDAHLSNSVKYTYRVRATKKVDSETTVTGEFSKTVSKSTVKGLTAPLNVQILDITANRVYVSWEPVAPAKSYAVYVSFDGKTPVYNTKTADTSKTIKLSHTNYSTLKVTVRAIGASGEGAVSLASAVDLRFDISGSLVKAYNAYGEDSTVRVEARKFGNSVAYIARVQTFGNMLTATAAEPGAPFKARYTSTQAKSANALIAVNGDYYSYSTRQQWDKIIRNGVIYKNNPPVRDHYIVYSDGAAKVLKSAEVPDANALLETGALQSFAFGPGLIRDGMKMSPFTNSETHPRTAIGYISPSEWVLLVVDGRQSGYSVGMTYSQAADVLLEMGCESAYNLDGGGSSCMYLKGAGVINRPCDKEGERPCSDIVYFK